MAGTNVKVPAMDPTIWKLHVLDTYRGAKRSEMLTLYGQLLDLRDELPHLPAEKLVERLQPMRDRYDQRINRGESDTFRKLRSEHEWLLRGLEVAAPFLGPAGGSLKETYKGVTEYAFKEWDATNKLIAAGEQYKIREGLRGLEQRRLDEMLASVKGDEELARAFDMLSPEVESIRDVNAAKVLQRRPKLPVPPAVREACQPDGSITIALDQLRSASHEQFDTLAAAIREGNGLLKDVDAKQDVLLAYAANAELRAREQADKATATERMQTTLEAADSVVSLLSTFIGREDPKLGRDIAVTGRAAVQVAQSVVQYVNTAASLGELGAALGGAVLTGNIVGAVMNVVALFGPQEPSPEQLILEGLGQLREQVAALHQDMHARFDRIDRQLNLIFDTVVDRFNRIDLQLGQLRGDVKSIQQDLVGAIATLHRFESNMLEAMRVGLRRDLLRDINGAIGYRDRTGLAMPFQPDFVTFENNFHAWATTFATDPVEVGPTQRSFADDDVQQELDGPLESNINYLAGWLRSRGLPSFVADQRTLANPRTWAMSSRAYAALELDWPQHAGRIDPDRRLEVRRPGEVLQEALGRITLPGVGAPPDQGGQMFRALLANYRAKLDELDASLAAVERAFTQQLVQELGQGQTGLDLWGGVDQPLQIVPDTLSRMGSAGTAPAAPAGLRKQVPHVCILADYLKGPDQASALDVTYQAGWTDEEERVHPKTGDITTWGRLRVTVTVRHGGVPVARHAIVGASQQRIFPPRWPTVGAAFDAHWERGANLKAKFEAGGAREVELPPDQQGQRQDHLLGLAAQVQERLRQHKVELHRRTFDELASGPQRRAAVRLAGAKSLIDCLLNLGLPRILHGDDLLRSLLYGTQSLPDDDAVRTRFAEAAAQEASSDRVRQLLKLDGERRGDALLHLVDGYLEAVRNDGHLDSVPLVETTLLTTRIATLVVAKEADIVSQLPEVRQGAQGPAVRRIQGLLRAALSDTSDANLAIDGSFGSNTQASVKRFQASVGLAADGVVGGRTWAELLGVRGQAEG